MMIPVDEVAALFDDEDAATAAIAVVESRIRAYTHNSFQVRGLRIKCPSDTALLSQDGLFEPGDRVQITSSGTNDGLYDVVSVSDGVITLDKSLHPAAANTVTVVGYPPDVVAGAISLLKWDISPENHRGYKSESLSRHSVSFDTHMTSSGYPATLVAFLKPYMRGRF
jgi:hypothetical protein